MQIKEILNLNNALLVIGNEDELLTNLSKDTRTIKEGQTYIAIVGENFDGNNFYLDALEKGAKTVIIKKRYIEKEVLDKYKNRNIILVDDTEEFLTLLAKKKRENIHVPVIAITGSVGKTSTRNIITSVLKTKYTVLRTKENLNTKIGLALTLMDYTNEEVVVLEMGMNHIGEIKELSLIAKPDVAIITNVGTAHIGNLGSRDNILKAKLEILEGLNGSLIVNNDNDLLNEWAKNNNDYKIITYGIDNDSNYDANNIEYNKNGSKFMIENNKFNINVFGKHFIYNSLVGYIIGKLYNINNNLIKQALENIPLEKNRMELINVHDYTIINDTYNASYDSVYYALDVLGKFKERKIACLGDILELGSYAKDIHENIGKLIVDNKIDILITVGDNAKYIDSYVKKTNCKCESIHFTNNILAINELRKIIKPNDIILVKASNGMRFIEIVNSLRE